MDRKFVIALSSLAGSLMLTDAHAIGLGEIRLRSSLNEPLKADIKLMQVNDLSENQILVSLAPADDFARAHVDRDFLLNSLRFRLDLDDPKNPKVVVTTQQPIREPFLNFLVEVQWPSGRLLREYTLLMDLPAFNESRATESVRAAKTTSVREPVESKPVKAPAAPRVSATKTQSPSVPAHHAASDETAKPKEQPAAVEKEVVTEKQQSSADGTYGPTRTNDTMWHIAQGVSGSGSVQQKILAIQRLNPGAFSNGNVNQLKKGQVLKLPTQEDISSIGRAEAIARMSEQQIAWKTGVRTSAPVVGAQLDATSHAQASVPSAAQPDGQLKLAAPAATADSGQAVQGSGAPGAEVTALQNDLTVGMEELNRAQRENQELASRAKDLDAQKESAEKLLQLQSNELAAMQAKLAAEQQAKAAVDAQAASEAQAKAAADAQAKATADAQAASEAQAKAAADAQAKATADAQAASEAQAKVAAEQQAKAMADAQAASEAQAKAAADAQAASDAQAKAAAASAQPAAPVPPQSEVAQPAPVITSPEVTSTEAKAPATVAAPAATESPVPSMMKPAPKVSPKTAEPSLVDSLMANPLIAGVAAVVVLLLGFLGYRRKAARTSSEAEYEQEASPIDYPAEESDTTEFSTDEPVAEQEYEQSAEDWDVDAVAQEFVPEAEVQAENIQPESGDVLGEADIYISFGNFDKGEALLKSAIKAEPTRSDYQVKLLELYKESGDLSAFDAAYKDLIELDDDLAIAKAGELRGSISGAATTPFAFGVSSAAAAAGISDEVDFDLDLDMDFDAPAAVQLDVEPEVETPELEISEVEAVVEPAEEQAAATEDASFFDVDFDLDAELESPNLTSIREAISVDAEDADEPPSGEFSLDFDLDLDVPVIEAESEVETQAVDTSSVAEYTEQETAMLGAVTADAGEIDEELDFLSDADEAATKLDLARAYIDMGDKEGARDILAEVMEEGRDEQKREAQALLDSIG